MELIKISQNENEEPCISGRELHKFLEVKTKYADWFSRMSEYGFAENVDFSVIPIFENDDTAFGGKRKSTDHMLKLDMAKELAMIQRTEKGKQARQYFIQVEKEYNSPEKIMARALMIAQKEISTLNVQVGQLEAKVEEQKPKVIFADAVSASHTTILIGELAKLLKQNGYQTGQNRLFESLREKGFLIKRGTSRNLPTQKSMELGLFEVKERTISEPNGSVRITKTPVVTGKGQQYFINLFLGETA